MSLEPDKKNFTIWKGATFHTRLDYHQGDENSPLVNLTGYSAVCNLRDGPGSSVVLLSLTSANGGVILGGAAGTIDLFIDDSVTAAIPWSQAIYELALTDSASVTDILLYGAFRVKGI